jgi:hypothetical protein
MFSDGQSQDSAFCQHSDRPQRVRRGRATKHSVRAFANMVFGLLLAFTSLSENTFAQRDDVRIVEVVWGFDGRVTPGQFNPVSLLLDNLTDAPLDGAVRLNAISGMINRAGGFYVQPVYLAANTRRWVQFYPYIARSNDTWQVVFRVDGHTYRFDAIQPGGSAFQFLEGRKKEPPVAVILDATGMPRQAPTTIKHMAEEIFPPYATAMSGLRILFMDHVPDWETPRQQALMSWIGCGGQLHLFDDVNGQTLQFSGEMSALNQPFPRFALGAGAVVRHNLQRAGITKQFVGSTLGTLEPVVNQDAIEEVLKKRKTERFGAWQASYFDPSMGDDEFLTGLRRLTQPDHAWWLILLLSVFYIGLIFPGCWILSQKRTLHFLVTYGAIGGLAVVFSGIFLLIGQRGYGESTVLNAVGIARFESDEFCSVMQWNSLFVTSGDDYIVTSDDHQSLFSAGNINEAVDVNVTAGNKARMETGIPPFSSQTYILRRRLPVPSWQLKATEIEAAGTSLLRMTLHTGPAFPSGSDCQYMALYRDGLYQLSRDKTSRTLTIQRSHQKLYDYCRINRSQDYSYTPFGMSGRSDFEQRDEATVYYEDSLHLLVQRSLLDDGAFDPLRYSLPDDRVRIYVYAPMPEDMFPTVSTQVSRKGRVLYVRDVPLTSVAPVGQAD